MLPCMIYSNTLRPCGNRLSKIFICSVPIVTALWTLTSVEPIWPLTALTIPMGCAAESKGLMQVSSFCLNPSRSLLSSAILAFASFLVCCHHLALSVLIRHVIQIRFQPAACMHTKGPYLQHFWLKRDAKYPPQEHANIAWRSSQSSYCSRWHSINQQNGAWHANPSWSVKTPLVVAVPSHECSTTHISHSSHAPQQRSMVAFAYWLQHEAASHLRVQPVRTS